MCLSESEDEEDIVPEPKPKRRRKKKVVEEENPRQKEVKEETALRALVGSRCKCKRRNCLREFEAADAFQSLLAYRKTYHELHKLDQDSFVSSLMSWFA